VRTALFVAACACSFASVAEGQGRASLVVELGEERPPEALVRVRGQLVDDRFFSALESGFPLHVELRVELKRPRALWDAVVERWEWSYVVLHDPVRDRYVIEFADGTEVLPDRAALRRRLGAVY